MITALTRWIRSRWGLPPLAADILLTAALTALSLGELVRAPDQPRGTTLSMLRCHVVTLV